MDSLTTDYAPALRKSQEAIIKEYDELQKINFIQEIFNSLPYLAMILNQERQIVFLNESMLNELGLKDVFVALGQRPGEILHCIHSKENPAGCGTTKACRYCGAVNTILLAQQSKTKQEGECRISSVINGQLTAFDLQISANPIIFFNQQYLLVSIQDISDAKRKQILEKTFFHDIMNSLSGLLMGVSLLKNNLTQADPIVEILDLASNQIVEEIEKQRDLISMEKDELVVKFETLSVKQIIKDLTEQYHQLFEKQRKKIILPQADAPDISFQTDKVLFKRVLSNLMKNALEAVKPGENITISLELKAPWIFISIHNPGYMQPEIQSQIFQRSFSTKGKGRGIGTYSIKLITEKYLKGEVSFYSTPEAGTVFTVKIPAVYSD